MGKYIITANGSKMLVTEMTDAHLINRLKLQTKLLQTAKTVLNTDESVLTPFQKTLIKSRSKMAKSRAKEIVENYLDDFSYLIAEAALRKLPQLSDILDELGFILEKDNALFVAPNENNVQLLFNSDDDGNK